MTRKQAKHDNLGTKSEFTKKIREKANNLFPFYYYSKPFIIKDATLFAKSPASTGFAPSNIKASS